MMSFVKFNVTKKTCEKRLQCGFIVATQFGTVSVYSEDRGLSSTDGIQHGFVFKTILLFAISL